MRTLLVLCCVVPWAVWAGPKKPSPPAAPVPPSAACLEGTPADKPVELKLGTSPSPLSFTTIRVQQTNGGGEQTVYALQLKDRDFGAEHSLTIGLLVVKGETVDGRVYESRLGVDMEKQPGVVVSGEGTSWSPRIYGFSLRSDPDDIEWSSGVPFSVRVTLLKREGTKIKGTIKGCVPGGVVNKPFINTPTLATTFEGTFSLDASELK